MARFNHLKGCFGLLPTPYRQDYEIHLPDYVPRPTCSNGAASLPRWSSAPQPVRWPWMRKREQVPIQIEVIKDEVEHYPFGAE